VPTSEYEMRLDRLLDVIFQRMARQGLTEWQLSRLAVLHYETVHKINYRLTRLPRLKTVMALARALGLELSLDLREVRRRTA
jgi:DNA-binding phage protein